MLDDPITAGTQPGTAKATAHQDACAQTINAIRLAAVIGDRPAPGFPCSSDLSAAPLAAVPEVRPPEVDMLLLTSRAAQAMDQAIHALLSKASMGMSPISLTLAWSDWLLHLAVSPGRLGTLAQLAAQLVHTSTQAQLGALDNSAAQQPAEVDDRFGDPLWRRWPFEQIRSGFLASSAWWKQASLVDGMARHNAHLVEFFTRQWLDALSPANWPATNPQVLTATLASGGQNLLNGGRLLVRDRKRPAKSG